MVARRVGDGVTMVFHRGANRVAPENTLAAAVEALTHGRVFVELDVRASADGVPFVMHDVTVDRTTNGTGPIAEMAASEVNRLDAGAWFGGAFAGEPVPRLEDMFDLIRGRGGLYVEIKSADPTTVMDLAERHEMLGDCFFWSEDAAILDGLRADRRDAALMIRCKDYTDLLKAMDVYEPAIVELTPPEVTAETFAICRELGGRPMGCYMGDDPSVFETLLREGVDLFNLDHPQIFMQVAGLQTPD